MAKKINTVSWFFELILGIIMIFLLMEACHVPQNHFPELMANVCPVFLIYVWVITKKNSSLSYWLLLGGVARIILAFQFPLLSDDIYRFYFDGQLSIHGINPYGVIPALPGITLPDTIHADVLSQMNSPNYYTIYPPVSQWFFALGAFSGSMAMAKTIMALMLVILESLAMIFLGRILSMLGKDSTNILWYYLNPLVILEGAGNLHFELLVVVCLIMMVYFLMRQWYTQAGIWWALGIGVKLTPLLLFPLLYQFLLGKDRKSFFIVSGVTTLIIFLPFLISPGFLTIFKSINLYFQSFEFNAGLYYLLREVGYAITGYNLIHYVGPVLAITTMAFIFKISGRLSSRKIEDFLPLALLSWLCYLVFSTTVHPWYLIPVLLLASLTGWMFVLTWSFLILLSYIHYDTTLNHLEPLALWVEYGIVFFLFYAYRKLWWPGKVREL